MIKSSRLSQLLIAALLFSPDNESSAQTKRSLQSQNMLWANSAQISEGLRFVDAGSKKATIHGWHSPDQTIIWKTNLEKGHYRVRLRYSQPRAGSAANLTIGGQQLNIGFKPTESWQDYQERALGIVKVDSSGTQEIKFTASQLAIEKDEKGNPGFIEALPDIHWLSLEATSEQENSESLDILKHFKGIPLFDGKTFDGWQGNDGQQSLSMFRIEDGAIIAGRTDKDIPRNEFLRTTREYKDFELRVKYKIKSTDDSYNAGVQFRSARQNQKGNEFEMVGYQADIISWKYGALYDEQRRWAFLGTPLAKKPAAYDPSDWNEYIIRCQGARTRIWLNGTLTLDYTEPFAEKPHPQLGLISLKGFIALQIHSGKPCEALYKDILLEEL